MTCRRVSTAIFCADELQVVPVDAHYQTTLELMARANAGDHCAGWLGRLSLERYFERIESGISAEP
jgi:hypothetical protein